MRPLNPNKLLLSKWTAVLPQNKERHFMVTELIRDDAELITGCILQAVINGHDYNIDWRELKNSEHWQQGWK
ncbi:TIGR02450 family Trp-rich protein [Aliamphritea ceti]|uniref:TIGR02450 family Trp-rich protein n=1 Tax=Aliamphritea ceti TaxID=1524258 RepID=UPI0021C42EE0|nr:TIGR02450 family Trp-rich protein [Aliamphritea ceti]